MPHLEACEIPLPEDSPIRNTMPRADYEEAFLRTLPNLANNISAQGLVDRMILNIPRFFKIVSELKGLALLPLGFSPLSFEQFKWIDLGPDQTVGMFYDKPFTAHIGISINRFSKEVVLSNRVLLHTSSGRIYFNLIKPIHKCAFKYLLNSL